MERARRQLDEPGENKPGDLPPALPETSPWSSTANVVPDEPLIDRREDAATGAPFDLDDGGE
jgi:hypothetical protein